MRSARQSVVGNEPPVAEGLPVRLYQRDPHFPRRRRPRVERAGQRGQLRRAAVAPVEKCIRRRHASRPALFRGCRRSPADCRSPIRYIRAPGRSTSPRRPHVPTSPGSGCPACAPRPVAVPPLGMRPDYQTAIRRPSAPLTSHERRAGGKGTRRGPKAPHGQRQPAARPGFAPGGQRVGLGDPCPAAAYLGRLFRRRPGRGVAPRRSGSELDWRTGPTPPSRL